MFTVYSHRDADDRILYVGQTNNLATRTREHARKAASQMAAAALDRPIRRTA
jgi:excinuclease UvrABC nuclease subunit